MTKHKIIIVWATLFLTVLILNIFFSVLIGGIWVMALSIPIILFLFCPIFIIDLLVSSKPSKLEPRKEKIEAQESKKSKVLMSEVNDEITCDFCGKKVDENVKLCPYCGAEL